MTPAKRWVSGVLLSAALAAGCGKDEAGSEPSSDGGRPPSLDTGVDDDRCPDGEPPRSFFPDRDEDGFGDGTSEPVTACEAPEGRVPDVGDCDDESPSTYPGADELCDDGVDNDCDDAIDYASGECTTLEGCSPPATFTAPVPADEGLPGDGLVLWLRADMGVSTDESDRVCEWKDVSGARNHFAQTVPEERPTLVGEPDGPAVRSRTEETVLREGVLDVAPSAGRTLFVVAAMLTQDVRSRPFWQGQTGTPGTYFGPEANTFNTTGQRFGVYLTNNAYDSDVATNTARRLHTVRVADLTPGTPVLDVLRYRVDGASTVLTRTPGGLGDGTVESIAEFERTWVGAQFGGGTVVRELLLYERDLSVPQLEAVEAYLASRHGLTLAR